MYIRKKVKWKVEIMWKNWWKSPFLNTSRMVTQNGHFVFPDTPSLHQRWPSDRPILPHPPPPEGSCPFTDSLHPQPFAPTAWPTSWTQRLWATSRAWQRAIYFSKHNKNQINKPHPPISYWLKTFPRFLLLDISL
jgi:hypothetical protein